ncbi:MAG: UvrABC system protein [Planctomycetota bacterium]|jgi:excinuclease ABC subunit A
MAKKKVRNSAESKPTPASVNPGQENQFIKVLGARVHNLKNLDISIPRDQLVVFSGVSGSGKSSLLFDTVYAEGQRRFLDTLSTYARQYLDQLDKPDVDSIDGLPPTVAIDQKIGTFSPRSTVGTITEIYDYLRLLYSKEGVPFCPKCRIPVETQSPDRITAQVLAMPDGQRLMLLAPQIRGRKGYHKDVFENLRKLGLIRARVDGEIIEIDPPPALDRNKIHTIEAVVDRLVVRDGIAARLSESLQNALRLGDGVVILCIEDQGQWTDRLLSTKAACPSCGESLPELEPRSFSFNSSYGACQNCEGLGFIKEFDPDLVIPNPNLTVAQGLIAPWVDPALIDRLKIPNEAILNWLKSQKLKPTNDYQSWSTELREEFWNGSPSDKKLGKEKFPGLRKILINQLRSLKNERQKESLQAYQSKHVCHACDGSRLKPESRVVQLAGMTIESIGQMPLDQAEQHFHNLRFSEERQAIGGPLAREIASRLSFLNRVGLSYLTLDRAAETLSGGELQRVRLAAQVGSGLVGCAYVLDEPTAGLHPRDTDRLIETLRQLRDIGNSVLVVEHDEAMIRSADWLIEIGPGAGPDGGRIVGFGKPSECSLWPDSPTAKALNSHPEPWTNDEDWLQSKDQNWIFLEGASEHNLKNISIQIPTSRMTSVTGVSGSGKSTLIYEILAPALGRAIGLKMPRPGQHNAIKGTEAIRRMVLVDQSPIGRTPRSTPATYTGLLDEIRKVYAGTKDAKLRGFKPSRFSYNVAEGRCPKCEGQGQLKMEMQFLADTYVECPECRGLRFNRATLGILFKGHSIGQLLQTRIDEALPLFENVPKVFDGLTALHDVGLGYLTLGQSSTTLSGGEAQRVKLAAELVKPSSQHTVFLLDEPTTGLHTGDVERLTNILKRLTLQGHTVVVIEHQLNLISQSDWVIDLGPEAGERGGQVVAMGRPSVVAANSLSLTGTWLARHQAGITE